MGVKFCNFIEISTSYNKPTPEPVMTQFTDTYLQHQAWMS